VTEKATHGQSKLTEGVVVVKLSPRLVDGIGDSSKTVTWANRAAGRGTSQGSSE
jgi:hypothetical protein